MGASKLLTDDVLAHNFAVLTNPSVHGLFEAKKAAERVKEHIAALTKQVEEAYAADAQKTREWNIMAQENRELAGQIEVLGDERFDAGYQMAIEHCVRVCALINEGLAGDDHRESKRLIKAIIAQIGLRAPDPSRLSRAEGEGEKT